MRYVNLLAAICIPACGHDHVSNKTETFTQDARPGFEFNTEPPAFREKEIIESDALETMRALARCGCAPERLRQYLEPAKRGTLTQFFTPVVRKKLESDESIEFLRTLPFSQVLTEIFATNEAVDQAIRTVFLDELSIHTPGGSDTSQLQTMRFDHFTSSSSSNTLSVEEEIPRWELTFRYPGLWEDHAPLGTDHGLQTLELLRTISEWSYLFGIQSLEDGQPIGGLTISLKGKEKTQPHYIAQEDYVVKSPIVAGTYRLAYPSANALQLATDIRESWTWETSSLSLQEQTSLWRVAALAYIRLQQAGTGYAKSLFAEDGLIPLETKNLPLAFLPGLKDLLTHYFIDSETRDIYSSVTISTSQLSTDSNESRRPSHTPATRSDLIALIDAMSLWIDALEHLDPELDPEMREQLLSAPSEMQRVIKLALQKILNIDTPKELVTQAQSLAALNKINLGGIKSPLLSDAVAHLANRFATNLATAETLNAAELIWANMVLKDLDTAIFPWVNEFSEHMDALLAEWQEAS